MKKGRYRRWLPEDPVSPAASERHFGSVSVYGLTRYSASSNGSVGQWYLAFWGWRGGERHVLVGMLIGGERVCFRL